jgi:hypothetical protein
LAAHAFEEGPRVVWDQAVILDVESNSLRRKYKETVHIMCCNNSISQASVEMSSLWFPVIKKELKSVGARVLFFSGIYCV